MTTTEPDTQTAALVRAEAYVHHDGTGTFTLQDGPVQVLDAGTPAQARTEVLRLAAAAAGEAGRSVELEAIVEGERTVLVVTSDGQITVAAMSAMPAAAAPRGAGPLSAAAEVGADGRGTFTLQDGPVQSVGAGTPAQARTEVLRLAAAAAGEAGRSVELAVTLDGERWTLSVAPDGAVALLGPTPAPSPPASRPPATISAPRRGRTPLAAAAGLVVVAIAGALLLRGCGDDAAPHAATHTSPAAASTSPSPTAAATSAAPSQAPSPIVANLRVRALTPTGGPLTLVLSAPPAGAGRVLQVRLRASDPHGRPIASRSLTLAAGAGSVRATFPAATTGVFSWQVTGAGFQAVTGTATVPAAPAAPASASSTYRPPSHTTTSTVSTSGSTSHHSSPKHHPSKPQSQPTKINVPVPPSPIERAASREGIQ